MSRLEGMKASRQDNLNNFRKAGIDPYPFAVQRTHTAKQASLKDDIKVTVVGRLMSWRGHGKLQFADLVDEAGKIQLAFRIDNFSEAIFDQLKWLDIGDFLQICGNTFTTKTGERTIEVKDWVLLCKTAKPLPSVWYGLKDTEDRYRRRYLDLILNPEVKNRLNIRSAIIQNIRDFLNIQGFKEVETPTLQPIYGGGFAKPFVTHHNVLDANFYLRISDEMYLKRLIVGGFEKVYEITKVFRNEGIDYDHNPEFTMFEAQIAYQDYTYGMDLIEEIIEHTAQKVLGKTTFDYQGTEISVKRPWHRYTMVEAVKEFTGVDPLSWQTIDDAVIATHQLTGIDPAKLSELKKVNSIGEVIAFVFEELVEAKLIQPTIIYDYPVENSPLAKKCPDPRFTQRFEMFAFGSELGNNYTELNDPEDLRQRFVEEKKREEAGFAEAHQTDYDYLEAIEHGFPPTCGLGVGIDRLVMLFTNATSIKEVIAFPTLKPIKKLSETFHLQSNTRFTIDAEVAKQIPDMFYGYVQINNVNITKSSKGLETLKEQVIKNHTRPLESISAIKSVNAYRNLFKKTHVWGEGRRPSPEALLRRIAQGKGIYNINTAVDAYNLAVVETGVGLGGFDATKISGSVTLKFTSEGESMLLLGDDEPTKTKAGELAYADSHKLITLDVNYRDIDETKITMETKNLLLFADGAPGLTEDEVIGALKKGAEYITRFCGGQSGEYQLVTTDIGSNKDYNYADRKIVCLVDKDLPPGKIANAVGHLSFAGGHDADKTWYGRDQIKDADGGVHRGISRYPVIILESEPEQIKKIRDEAIKQGLSVRDYPKAMFTTAHDDELATKISKQTAEDIIYHALLIIGESAQIDPLTADLKVLK